MEDESDKKRIDELEAEIIQLVVDFALAHPQIKSPLVIRGLELYALKNKRT